MLVPFSEKWLVYWDRQFYLYMTGQDFNAIRQAPVDAFRAVMQYSDNPASLGCRIEALFHHVDWRKVTA